MLKQLKNNMATRGVTGFIFDYLMNDRAQLNYVNDIFRFERPEKFTAKIGRESSQVEKIFDRF